MTGVSEGRGRTVELEPEDGDQPAGRIFALVLDELLEELRRHEPAVRAGDDPDALHDYRVALRRARSILRAGERVYPPEELELLRALSAELSDATSPVRDLDVLLESFERYAGDVAHELDSGVEQLRAELESMRSGARSRLLAFLDGDEHPVLLRRWQVMASVHRLGGSDPGPDALRPAGEVSGELILHAYERLVRGSRRRLESPDPADWHKVRKRAKRLRYLVTAFAPVHPPGAYDELTDLLPKVQDRFGRLQDHVEHARLLEDAGLRLGGRAALAAGAICDGLHHAAHRDLVASRKKMAKLRTKQVRRSVERAAGGG